MTNRELIAQLQKLPLDIDVKYVYDGVLRADVDLVFITKGGDIALSHYGETLYHTDDRPIDAPSADEQIYWDLPETLTKTRTIGDVILM